MADEDVLDRAGRVQRVIDAQDMTSGHAENMIHALGDERVDDRSARIHLVHHILSRV
jgi:hypothetical protein